MTTDSRPTETSDSSPDYLKWIAGGYLIFGLLASGISILSLFHSRNHHQERVSIVARNLAQVLEQSISSSIVRIDSGVRAVVREAEQQLAKGKLDETEITDLIHWQLSLHPEVDGIRIADAQGNIAYGTGVSPNARFSAADRDYFLRAKADPKIGLQIAKPVLGRINGKWIVVFVRRINLPNGGFGGIAFATVTLDYFQRLFSSLDLGNHGLASLRGMDYGLLARFPQLPSTSGGTGNTLISSEFVDSLAKRPDSGVYLASSRLDGIERTFAYRLVPAYPAYVFVGLATKDYMGEWQKDRGATVVLILLLLSTSLLSSWLIYRAWKRQALAVESLRAREGYQKSLLNNFPFSVWLKDKNGRYLAANKAFSEAVGLPSDSAVIGLTDYDMESFSAAETSRAEDSMVMAEGNPVSVEKIVETGGQPCWIELYKSPITVNQQVVGTVGFSRNIDARKNLEERIKQLAFYDPLTSLANRRLLQDRLNLAITACRRSKQFGLLMFIDLDNFKPINDTYGHDLGDLLLIEVARRLKSTVRETDTVSRFGGDEFVIMISDLGQEAAPWIENAEGMAKKILSILSAPYILGPNRNDSLQPESIVTCSCQASIGIAFFSAQTSSENEVLRKADEAMYRAKQRGGGSFDLSEIPP